MKDPGNGTQHRGLIFTYSLKGKQYPNKRITEFCCTVSPESLHLNQEEAGENREALLSMYNKRKIYLKQNYVFKIV